MLVMMIRKPMFVTTIIKLTIAKNFFLQEVVVVMIAKWGGWW